MRKGTQRPQRVGRLALRALCVSLAVVHSIAADAVSDEKRGAMFPVSLLLNKAVIDVDGKPIRLAAGMNLTAEVITGRRRIIEFILKPSRQHISQSLGGR